MKTVGIFLGVDPGSGGMFQYSLAMSEALSALSREQYKTVAAFLNPAWRSYIEPLGLRLLQLRQSGREAFTPARFWRSAHLPVSLWRALLARTDPVSRTLMNQGCDLWIFPAQDHWSYLTPVPALVAVHDLMHRYETQFPEVSRWGRYFFREYRFRNICGFAKAVLTDSELGRMQVIDSYGVNPQKVFSLPYLPPRYMFERATPTGFDVRYKLPKKFLFYPAQFWPHKNHDRLLQALGMVRHSCPDVFLVLAGPKRYEYRNIMQRITELGLGSHVLFTDYVPDADLPEFYRRARALVMPTFFGPTNIPPLEAFVCGCPVAVSHIYGMPEQVGNSALLFDPSSIEEIAAAVKKLWVDDELCRVLIAKGYEKIAGWGQREFSDALLDIMTRMERVSLSIDDLEN